MIRVSGTVLHDFLLEASLDAVDRPNAGGGLAMTDSTWRLRRS
jgi:hypothetical protein